MRRNTAAAFFCEDIREEKNGAFTLIGIMPDTITVIRPSDDAAGKFVPMIPKLCIFARFNCDLRLSFKDAYVRVVAPDDSELIKYSMASDLREAIRLSNEKGNLLGGVNFRFIMGGFTVVAFGHMKVEMAVDDDVILAGELQLVPFEEKPTVVSTAS